MSTLNSHSFLQYLVLFFMFNTLFVGLDLELRWRKDTVW